MILVVVKSSDVDVIGDLVDASGASFVVDDITVVWEVVVISDVVGSEVVDCLVTFVGFVGTEVVDWLVVVGIVVVVDIVVVVGVVVVVGGNFRVCAGIFVDGAAAVVVGGFSFVVCVDEFS